MKLTELYQIDGKPMIPPDADMSVSFEDLDAEDSGRDESGTMHRIVVRHKLGAWHFSYDRLTNEEYRYMESLFAGKSEFRFTHPSRTNWDVPEVTKAYRSKYSITWHSRVTRDYRNYGFTVIEC